MTLTTLDAVVVALYFLVMLGFAGLVRRRGNFADYTVADRGVPPAVAFATLSATFIGPGYSLGLAGKGASSGFLFLLPFFMFSVQTILVGLFLAPRLHALTDCHSLGDVMARYYGRAGKLLTGVVSVGLCLGLVSVMARAGGVVVANSLGVSLEFGVALITVVGMAYALTGGLRAVIATEAVQFGLLVAVFSILALFIAPRVESFEALQAGAIATTKAAFAKMPRADLIALCVSFLLGEALIPPYANRALAADSAETSRRAFVLAGLFSILWFLMLVVIGYAGGAVISADVLAHGDAALMTVGHHLLPSGLWGLLIVGVAAVVMSSQESVLNAGAVAFVRDIVLPNKPHLKERAQLIVAKAATLILGVLGIWIALQAPSIIEGLLVCYALWAPTVLPPLVWALLGLPTNRLSGTLAILGGAAGAGVALFEYGTGSVLFPLGYGFGASAAGAAVGAVWTRVGGSGGSR